MKIFFFNEKSIELKIVTSSEIFVSLQNEELNSIVLLRALNNFYYDNYSEHLLRSSKIFIHLALFFFSISRSLSSLISTSLVLINWSFKKKLFYSMRFSNRLSLLLLLLSVAYHGYCLSLLLSLSWVAYQCFIVSVFFCIDIAKFHLQQNPFIILEIFSGSFLSLIQRCV